MRIEATQPSKTHGGFYMTNGDNSAPSKPKRPVDITVTEGTANDPVGPQVADLKIGQALKYKLSGNTVARLAGNVFVKVYNKGTLPPVFFDTDHAAYFIKYEPSVMLPEGTTLTIKLQ